MNVQPSITPASFSPASPLFDTSRDTFKSLNTSFTTSETPDLETTTVTEVSLGYHRNGQYSITAMTTSSGAVGENYTYTAYGQPTILNASGSVPTSSAVGALESDRKIPEILICGSPLYLELFTYSVLTDCVTKFLRT